MALNAFGQSYEDHRRHTMLTHQEGLTKTYNRFHNPDEGSTDIKKLRELHVEMDHAVAAAYGWTDLDLSHDFGVTKQGLRYTISELARQEVLARLLKLNHERYAEEVKQGLHDPKSKRSPKSKVKASEKTKTPANAVDRTLFDLDQTFPTTKRDKLLCGLLCDLVAAQPGLPATAYLDTLVIAFRHDRHNRLLIGDDRTQFTALAEKSFKGINLTDGPMSWAEVVRVLSLQGAVSQDGSTLTVGANFEEMRKLHPTCDPQLIALLHKAGATLRDFQGIEETESPEKAELVREHNQSKLECFGVAA